MPATLPAIFAEILRAQREAAGWTQEEIAERTGLAVEAYGRLERGRILPRAATLVSLARALDVTTDRLLGLEADSTGSATPKKGTQKVAVSPDHQRLLRRLKTLPPKAVRLFGLFLAALEE